jgi:NodT family efflux transporter outer membrane factor (OMF) lipoprotein
MKHRHALILLALLAGCSAVGPNYQRPAEAVINEQSAKQPFAGSNSSLVVQAPVSDQWWHLYQDEHLNSLVEEALRANKDIKVAAANIIKHKAILSAVQSEQDIKVGANAAAARARLSGESYLLPEALPVTNLGEAGVNVSYQVDLVGAMQRAAEAANADLAVSRAELDLARISIVADVMLSYSDNCAAGHQLEIAQHSLELQQKNQSAVMRLIADGRKTRLDIPRANSQVEQIKALIPVYQSQQRTALYRLAVLTGHPPADFSKMTFSCTQLPELSQPIPIGDGASLLRRRPDVHKAEQALVGATARVGMSTAALYPTITLGFSGGATGILDHLGQAQTQRFSLGPLISWTLPGELEHARLRMADSAVDESLARFDSVVLKALLEVESALAIYAGDQERETQLRHAHAEAAESSAQIRTLYQAGRLSYLEYLDAERRLSDSEAALAIIDITLVRDQVRLFLALGGWGNDS